MNSISISRTIVVLTMAFSGMLLLTGCGGYTLQGRVIRGQTSGAEIVHEMDLRMRSPAGGGPTSTPPGQGLVPASAGVGNVEVSLYRDPNTLNQKLAARDRTNGDGYFTLHVSDFGAGWMDEKWQAIATSAGFQNAQSMVKLAGKTNKTRLLITLAPGQATATGDDVMQGYDKFK